MLPQNDGSDVLRTAYEDQTCRIPINFSSFHFVLLEWQFNFFSQKNYLTLKSFWVIGFRDMIVWNWKIFKVYRRQLPRIIRFTFALSLLVAQFLLRRLRGSSFQMEEFYRAFHEFGQAKFPDVFSDFGSIQFSILPLLPLKMMLGS